MHYLHVSLFIAAPPDGRKLWVRVSPLKPSATMQLCRLSTPIDTTRFRKSSCTRDFVAGPLLRHALPCLRRLPRRLSHCASRSGLRIKCIIEAKVQSGVEVPKNSEETSSSTDYRGRMHAHEATYNAADAVPVRLVGDKIKLDTGHTILENLTQQASENPEKSRNGALVLGISSDQGQVSLLDVAFGRLQFQR